MIWVGILGARGYFGEALPKLVAGHRLAQVSTIMDLQELCEGELYSCRSNEARSGYWSMVNAIKNSDVIFNGLSGSIAEEVYSKAISYGKKVIDISNDQYLGDRLGIKVNNSYPGSVYGLSELYRDKMKDASVATNPSGYCTGAVLGLAPIAAFNTVDMNTVSIESKSGITSLGRNDKLTEVERTNNDSTIIYKMESRKYAEEVNEQIFALFGKEASTSYVAYIIPGIKGITTTIKVNLHTVMSESDIFDVYRDFYKDNPLIEVCSNSNINGTMNRSKNCSCKLHVSTDEDYSNVTVTTVFDDALKGVASQVIQTMNLMSGIDSGIGL